MMLRKCTNHPYLIEYPLTSDGNFRLDEQLIESSGKMMMLDVMLRTLSHPYPLLDWVLYLCKYE